MAPNLLGTSALFLTETTENSDTSLLEKRAVTNSIYQQFAQKSQENLSSGKKPKYKWDIVWRNVLGMIYLHAFSLYGLYLTLFVVQWKTFFWGALVIFMAGQGITAGAHRLWAHRCYRAKLPLRILLAYCQTMAFQNHIFEWVRDHRVHHKFTDTDADPHNAQRGFFFSHVGWLLVKKHKDVRLKGRTVDMSDLESDGVVRFQRTLYPLLMPLICFVIPCCVPWYFWNENPWASWYTIGVLRYTFTLNGTWLVNSAAHIYGNKPYDKTIGPSENKFVSYMALGEGWHNYHHVFPWDYKASELGYNVNITTSIIDLFAKIGWAYDLKTVSEEMVRKRALRTGDGSRKVAQSDSTTIKPEELDNSIVSNNNNDKVQEEETSVGSREGNHNHISHHHHGNGEENVWGWGDRDMSTEEIQEVKLFNKLVEVE